MSQRRHGGLLDHYRGDISLTAAAYNAGETCVRKVTGLLGTAHEEAAGAEGDEGRLAGKG